MAASLQAVHAPCASRLGYFRQYQGFVEVVYVVSKRQGYRVVTRSSICGVDFFLHLYGSWLLSALWGLRSRLLVVSALLATRILSVLCA